MGRNKRQKLGSHAPKRSKPKPQTKNNHSAGISKSDAKPAAIPKRAHTQHTQPTIPFSPDENILLIGEGDLSFARSLILHHGCTQITSTVFESEAELKAKYPQAEENIRVIEEAGGIVKYGIDATKMKPWNEGKGKPGVMDRIIFNFPHVGGKSTDVNRQVRYNQEMLVSFFKQAIPSLSPRHGSSIIITLFEGEPYTLWNIRDLGRYSDLQVAESFKFQASAYPGYKHARTLGVVKGKNGEVGGGWRGEERAARSFVFVRKGEGVVHGEGKRKRGESSDESEGEETGNEEEEEEAAGTMTENEEQEGDSDQESTDEEGHE